MTILNTEKNIIPFCETKEVKYFCDKHGEVVGRVLKFFASDRGTLICPVCAGEEDAEIEAQRREKEKIEKAFENIRCLKSCNIEPEFYYKEITDFNPQTESQKEALEAVKNLIKTKQGKIILIGSNGVGKTFLGSMAVKALGGRILSMYEIATMIRQSYVANAEKTELEIVMELASIPMLVIDELGRTKGSDSELNWLSYILDKRHTRNLPFMLLTNKQLSKKAKNGDCFEKYVDNDVLSRLQQDAKIITLEAPDFRRGKK